AVDHGIEAAVERSQVQGVHPGELGVQATLLGLPPGLLDGSFEEVEAQHGMAPLGEEQGVLAGPAAGVQYVARHPIGNLDERPLWPADVPGGLAGVQRLEGLTARDVAHLDL